MSAEVVANNMRYINHEPPVFFNHAQNDRATHNNPDNIRNILICGIKKQLGMNQDEYIYKNDHEIIFDFRKYEFVLSQEIQHIERRLDVAKAFKYGHVDSGYIRKDLNAIIKMIRMQFDPLKSPTILYTKQYQGPLITKQEYYPPYELIKYCPLLKDSKYDYYFTKAIRALWMRRGTKQEAFKRDLEKFLTKYYMNGISRSQLRDELCFIIDHTPPHLLPAFFSVKNIILI